MTTAGEARRIAVMGAAYLSEPAGADHAHFGMLLF